MLYPRGPADTFPCAVGDQLEQQYDSALQEWKMRSQPQLGPFVEGEAAARRAFQLREEALIEGMQPPIACTSIGRFAQFVDGGGEMSSTPCSLMRRSPVFGGHEVRKLAICGAIS